jgi:hypothetical protein
MMIKMFKTLILLAGCVAACQAKPTDTSGTVMLPTSQSGYVLSKGTIRVYFLVNHTGELRVALRAKAAKDTKIQLRLDARERSPAIRLKPASGYAIVPAGTYTVSAAGYHFIEIKQTGDTANSPDIPAIALSGPACKDIQFNGTEYKGAPATHLHYLLAKDTVAAWFYSEISVPKEADSSVNAYYETNGFADGYMGIQHNSKEERRFIFSVWSNYRTDNYENIPPEYAIKLLKKGKDVFSGGFGNEGSGGHSHLVFNWKPDVTYKLLVGAKASGDHTIFTAYYFAPENGEWKLIAAWDKTKTGGKLLSGLYAFVENFGDNGLDYFSARYGNQWVCTPSGTWIELTKARFTTTADPVKHPRYDYGGGSEGKWFYMFTGGFKKIGTTSYGLLITRMPSGQRPIIDFSALPKE